MSRTTHPGAGRATLVAAVLLIACVALPARAQTGPDLLLKTWDKNERVEASVNGMFLENGHTKQEDADFRLSVYETEGRFRLIPGNVRAQVIATARISGKTRVVEAQVGSFQGIAQPAKLKTEPVTRTEVVGRPGPYAPTEKQIAFYQRLADSPVFTDEERKRALDWLASKATRQTIKDQIDWLKRQVETRKVRSAGESAA